jgi:hypothetical protein
MAYVDLDSLHVPSAGQRPPASWGAQVNENFDVLYDEYLAKLGVWTSWAPTVTQAGSITKTVTYARYIKLGRLVIAQAYLAITGAGSSATAVTVSLPATAAQSALPVGTFYLYDASAGFNYVVPASLASTTTVNGLITGTSGVIGTNTFTAALASGDSVLIDVKYESAS